MQALEAFPEIQARPENFLEGLRLAVESLNQDDFPPDPDSWAER